MLSQPVFRNLPRRLPLLLVPLGAFAYLASSATTPVRAAAPPSGLGDRTTLSFIKNEGQVGGAARYYVRGRDRSVYFTPTGLTYALVTSRDKDGDPSRKAGGARRTPSSFQRYALKLDFVDANAAAEPQGTTRREGVVNYLAGPRAAHRYGIPTFGGLRYDEVWKGVDVAYQGVENGMKYEFQLEPGADPRQVRLAYRGATNVAVNSAGQLVAETPSGALTDDAPIAYQDIQGRRVKVDAKYEIRSTSGSQVEYGFRLGKYDPSQALVIDPAVLIYCGYVGGADRDLGAGIAVDSAGSAYVAGYTYSAADTFPEDAGFDSTYGGQGDAFVAKILPEGTGFEYCTYLGGTDNDTATCIAVDAEGRACVGGTTLSSQASFPVITGPDLTYSGEGDGWVARLSSDGASLDYCGYVGGIERDAVYGISEALGSVAVTGDTASNQASFPVSGGPSLVFEGETDAFVSLLTDDGTGFQFSGYIGGAEIETGNGVDIAEDGVLHVAGTTASRHDTFPLVVGPDLTYNGGDSDGFIARVQADGQLTLLTYLGGFGADQIMAVSADPAGNTYVAGFTDSDERTFPALIGPDLTHSNRPQPRRRRPGPLPAIASQTDGFVAKLPAHAASLDYCGYVGGSGLDAVFGIVVDSEGFAYIAGQTQSNQRSFPVTIGPDLKYGGGFTDAFVGRVHSDGTRFNYLGYLGGTSTDAASGVAIDSAGAAYVSGFSSSTPNTFPVRNGPITAINGGASSSYGDAFLAKVSPFTARPPRPGRLTVRPKQLRFGKVRVGRTKTLKLRLQNQGGGPLTVNLPTLLPPYGLSQTGDFVILPGARKNVDVTFSPTATGRVLNGIVITSDDPRSPLFQVPLRGRGR